MEKNIKINGIIQFDKENKTEEEIFRNRMDLLYREIFYAKEQYFIFNDMCMNGYSEKYKNYNVCIFDAVEYSMLIKLAKIFEKDTRNDSITIFYILNAIQSNKKLNEDNEERKNFAEENLEKLNNMKSIDKLDTFRNKNIAHLDRKYYEGIKSINKANNFAYNDIKELIDIAEKIIKKAFLLLYNETTFEKEKFEKFEKDYKAIKELQ